ncbi:MAG: glycosyltransferase family 2 protein, partial [Candidatus Gracilibacteria bacterium]
MRIKQPLVSIGVPTYNRSRFLREAIDSVLNQTYTNFELIISDNASTDDTERLCKEYSNKDKRIKYFRQKENIGIDANFYFVLNEAHGEYFAWLPDDDLYSPQFIEKLLEGFVDESVAGVFCREIC